MCPDKSSHTRLDIIGYTYPVYHETKKDCYVDFYCLDHRTGVVKRKKYHLKSIKGKRERRQYARILIVRLAVKLEAGWRPWSKTEHADRGYKPLEECLEKYMDRIRRTGRRKTIHTYQTSVNMLRVYFGTIPRAPKYVNELSQELISDFLDWLIEERNVCPRTRNNYRNWLAGFCEYLLERKFLAENPVNRIERIKETEKRRKSLTKGMLEQLFEHLKKTDPHFLLASMMEYYTFIRPNELHYLKIGDINIKEQRIFVSGDISKNHRSGYVALNRTVILQMVETGLFNSPNDYYIFGKDFRPAKEPGEYNLFNKRWDRLRKELGWSSEFQFYSLKDSGIRDLANSEGIVTARNQARHTDISTTNKYLEGRDGNAPEAAKNFKGGLG